MPVQVDIVRGPLPASTAAAVRTLVELSFRADGVAPISEQPLLWLDDPHAKVAHVLAHDDRHHRAHEASRDEPRDEPREEPRDKPRDEPRESPRADAPLVGYAQVDVSLETQASAELTVSPAARRQGLGTRLLAEARALAAAVPGRSLHVWAHGDLPAGAALTRSAGGIVTRELLMLRADLAAPRPAKAFPPAVTVRAFVPDRDEDAWRRVNARAFAHHPEQGRMSDADLRAREREPWFDPAGFLLAERDGVLLGFVWTKVHPAGAHGPAPVGEIYVVGVDPDAQGLGLGGALISAGMDHLAARGLATVILYTDADNTVAVHTYERLGFARAAVDRMFTFDTSGSPSDDTMGA